ncbi:MAG: Hsp20/alpha crystallin family protein [Nitrospirota bacterium]
MAEPTREVQKREAPAPAGAERTKTAAVYSPYVDIIERKDDIVLLADMPGVDENSVDILLEKNILTIYGKVRGEITERHQPDYMEYGIGDYQRAFTLSDEIDRDKILATVKNGVLKLVLAKTEAMKSRKINVTAEA